MRLASWCAVMALLAASGEAPGAPSDAPPGAPPGGPPGETVEATAKAQGPFDLTGYWVALVTQDWLLRMVVPQRGQYTGIPMTPKAKAFADAWQAEQETADSQCKAYGAAAIMQIPARLHITWQDENTLKIETDAGMQVRLLHFRPDPSLANAAPSWQGYSVAQWMIHGQGGGMSLPGSASAPRYGWLRATTTNMRAGLLRKNGVPYSAQMRMTENWVLNEADGDQWLTVTTTLDDPEYLAGPLVQNAIFKREPNGQKWDPRPCTLRE